MTERGKICFVNSKADTFVMLPCVYDCSDSNNHTFSVISLTKILVNMVKKYDCCLPVQNTPPQDTVGGFQGLSMTFCL